VISLPVSVAGRGPDGASNAQRLADKHGNVSA